MADFESNRGYTLIELVLVLVIIGVLATVGLRSLSAVNRTSRIEQTRQDLDRLAHAIAGNPELAAAGARTDFGYVGDVGGLPPDLDALAVNPGGWSTWQGPYIGDQFSSGGASTNYKYDAWGGAFVYSGGVSITSTGGGVILTRQLAGSVADLLYNPVRLVVTDIDRTPPGTIYDDSLRFLLTVPNGSGEVAVRTVQPQPSGFAQFDSVPIGIHLLRLVYLPTADTLARQIVVTPGAVSYLEMSMAENLWTGS
ncbi:MAG: type II secretion system protein [Candidatus Zixiibacteriota bacterium]